MQHHGEWAAHRPMRILPSASMIINLADPTGATEGVLHRALVAP